MTSSSEGTVYLTPGSLEQVSHAHVLKATIDLFKHCNYEESDDSCVDRHALAKVLGDHLGEGAQVADVFKFLDATMMAGMSEEEDRVDFLRYWEAMDRFLEENGRPCQFPRDGIGGGMQEFRDGVIVLASELDGADSTIPSQSLLTLLGDIRSRAKDASYWDEVMEAVPPEENFGLSLSEVAEAVLCWLEDFIRAQAEGDTSIDLGAIKSSPSASPAASPEGVDNIFSTRSNSTGSECVTSVMKAMELADVIVKATGPENSIVHKALSRMASVHQSLEAQLAQQEADVVELRESNSSLSKRQKTLETQYQELLDSHHEIDDLVHQRDDYKKAAEQRQHQAMDMKEKYEAASMELKRMQEEVGRQTRDQLESEKREQQWKTKNHQLQEVADKADGQVKLLQSEIDRLNGQIAAEKQKTENTKNDLARCNADKEATLKRLENFERQQRSSTKSDELVKEVVELKARLMEQGQQLQNSEQKLQKNEQLAAKQKQEIQDRDKRIEGLTVQLQEAQAEALDSNMASGAELHDRDSKLSDLRLERAKSDRTISQLEEQLEQKDNDLHRMELQLAQQIANQRRSSTASGAGGEKLSQVLTEAEDLKSAVATRDKELERANDVQKNLEDQVNTLKLQLQDANEQVRRSREQREEALKERRSSASQSRESAASAARISSELDELKTAMAEQSAQLSECRDKLRQREEKIQRLSATVDEKKAQTVRDTRLLEDQVKAQQVEIDQLRSTRDELVANSISPERASPVRTDKPAGFLTGGIEDADDADLSTDHLQVYRKNETLQKMIKDMLRHTKELEKSLDDAKGGGSSSAAADGRRKQSLARVVEEWNQVFNENNEKLHTIEVQKEDADKEVFRLSELVSKQEKELARLKEIQKHRDTLLLDSRRKSRGSFGMQSDSRASTALASTPHGDHARSATSEASSVAGDVPGFEARKSNITSGSVHSAHSGPKSADAFFGDGPVSGTLFKSPKQREKDRADKRRSSVHHKEAQQKENKLNNERAGSHLQIPAGDAKPRSRRKTDRGDDPDGGEDTGLLASGWAMVGAVGTMYAKATAVAEDDDGHKKSQIQRRRRHFEEHSDSESGESTDSDQPKRSKDKKVAQRKIVEDKEHREHKDHKDHKARKDDKDKLAPPRDSKGRNSEITTKQRMSRPTITHAGLI